jgi:hypothetical protein
MKETDILIGPKIIGSGTQVFVIAEIGINHDGSAVQAEKLIDDAADAGADAVSPEADAVEAGVEAEAGGAAAGGGRGPPAPRGGGGGGGGV